MSTSTSPFSNPKKREFIKIALIGVCKEIDESLRAIGEESHTAATMKQRFENEGESIYEELAKDESIMEILNVYIDDD